MKYKEFAFGILVILLVSGVKGFSASAPGGNRARNLLPAGPDRTQTREIQGLASEVLDWQQVNEDGFGDPDASAVSALSEFNGNLYAGTINPTDGARIFRSGDGLIWTPVTDPGFGNAHDTRPPAILDMLVFDGRLYASTGLGDGPAQIWRTVNGVDWAPMTMTGFSNPDTVDITPFAEYGGWIYTGAANLISGAQIWRSMSGDNNTWTKVFPAELQSAPGSVTGMAVFDAALYAAVDSEWTAQIWRSDGGAWTAVMSNGFGDPSHTSTGGMAVFAGHLYVGGGHQVDSAQLWRTDDGVSWDPVIEAGFGDPQNQKVEMVFVFQNHLYASLKNEQTGIELWRSPDGTTWEQDNQDGFGDGDNSGTNGSNAVAEFLGNLYVGTSNVVDGGELWRLHLPTPEPTPQPTPEPTQPPPPASIYLPIILGWP